MEERKGSILVVDDDINFAKSASDILEHCGYDCTVVHNGREGIEKIKSTAFDIVLSDIKMPGMDGVRMVREIKSIRPQINIVMMTAFRQEEKVQDVLREGIYGCLLKPLDFQKLLKVLERCRKGGGCIAIADDDPNTRETLRDYLEECGYIVTATSTEESALKLAVERPQDLMIADVRLAHTSGIELFRKIRRMNPRIKIALVTAFENGMREEIEALRAEGLFKVLYKPLDMEALRKLIEAIIEEREKGAVS